VAGLVRAQFDDTIADEIEARYNRSAERLRHPVHQIDQQLMHTSYQQPAAHS
jgi:hypothetical protein